MIYGAAGEIISTGSSNAHTIADDEDEHESVETDGEDIIAVVCATRIPRSLNWTVQAILIVPADYTLASNKKPPNGFRRSQFRAKLPLFAERKRENQYYRKVIGQRCGEKHPSEKKRKSFSARNSSDIGKFVQFHARNANSFIPQMRFCLSTREWLEYFSCDNNGQADGAKQKLQNAARWLNNENC